MNHARAVLLLFMTLISGHAVQAVAASADETAAREVLAQYFSALSQGDTATLRSLLGGELLQKRSRLLNNPSYPEHLVESYGQADFHVLRSAVVGEDSIAIEAVVILSADERVNKRYLIIRESPPGAADAAYRIHDESIVNR